MNIILIGNNGAGKTTIATRLYKEGYHLLKEGPLGSHHAAMATLCLTDYHIVFDRWNVIDRYIYENEKQYLDLIALCPKEVNRNNVIIYLTNNVTPYDHSKDSTRSVQRPAPTKKDVLESTYLTMVNKIIGLGIHVYHVAVRSDVEETYALVKEIIENVELSIDWR
mgnify:CR=1 FL=1